MIQPLHTALLAADWHRRTLYRWLIAWWYYRSSGLACWIALQDESNFWDRMLCCAYSTTTVNPLGHRTWPRGEGQEWFRGQTAAEEMRDSRFTWGDRPEDMVQSFINGAPHHQEIMKRVIGYTGLARCDTALLICADLQCLNLCQLNLSELIYPSSLSVEQLRSELEPWSRYSELAATLLEKLDQSRTR